MMVADLKRAASVSEPILKRVFSEQLLQPYSILVWISHGDKIAGAMPRCRPFWTISGVLMPCFMAKTTCSGRLLDGNDHRAKSRLSDR